jgi:hypothetical protein
MAMAAVRFAARRLTSQQQQAILRPAVLNRGLHRFTSTEACAANVPKVNIKVTSPYRFCFELGIWIETTDLQVAYSFIDLFIVKRIG